MLFESKIHIKDKLFFAVISIATTLNVKKSLRPELYCVFFAYFNNENANARM
jgi:hypothetical protein